MKKIILYVLLFTVAIFTACSTEESQVKVVKERPVLVKKLSAETYVSGPSYSALIKPKTIVKKAFTKDGVIEKNYLSQGDKVWIGSYLSTINGVTDKIKLDYSIEPLKTLKNEMMELEDRYWSKRNTYIKSYLKKISTKSDDDVDADKREYLKAKKSYYDKREEYKKFISYLYFTNHSVDISNVLYADLEGYVLQYINAEGEAIGAGYPVVVLASRDQVVEAGLSLEDAKSVEIGDVVEVQVNVNSDAEDFINKFYVYAVVTEIDNFPDVNTGTYNIRAELFGKDIFNYGETVNIQIRKYLKEGIFVSVSHILNDGNSYVYIVKDGRAHRKNIEIIDVENDRALVKGLSPDDMMIVRGYNSISDGYKVKVSVEGESGDE